MPDVVSLDWYSQAHCGITMRNQLLDGRSERSKRSELLRCHLLLIPNSILQLKCLAGVPAQLQASMEIWKRMSPLVLLL